MRTVTATATTKLEMTNSPNPEAFDSNPTLHDTTDHHTDLIQHPLILSIHTFAKAGSATKVSQIRVKSAVSTGLTEIIISTAIIIDISNCITRLNKSKRLHNSCKR